VVAVSGSVPGPEAPEKPGFIGFQEARIHWLSERVNGVLCD
jgi:hypothetical protein